jgi:hypothetical protein
LNMVLLRLDFNRRIRVRTVRSLSGVSPSSDGQEELTRAI